jgi:hypothetical protein
MKIVSVGAGLAPALLGSMSYVVSGASERQIPLNLPLRKGEVRHFVVAGSSESTTDLPLCERGIKGVFGHFLEVITGD